MSFAPDTETFAKPQALLRVPVGLASPLWGLFAGAAMTGATWWWMTRWARPENLEAMFGAAAEADAAVESEDAVLAAVAEVVEFAPEPAVEVVAEATPEPMIEALEPFVPEPPVPEPFVAAPNVPEPDAVEAADAAAALETAAQPKRKKAVAPLTTDTSA